MRRYGRPELSKGGGVDIDELERLGLTDTITEVPLSKNPNGSYQTHLPPGYSFVNNAHQPVPVEKAEAERGGWVTGDQAWLNDDDWNTIQGLKKDTMDALGRGDTDTAQKLHEQAQQIRYKYGYSGGQQGNQYLPTMAETGNGLGNGNGGGSGNRGGSFGGGINGNYNNRYQARIDALTDAILNRGPFSYDKMKDPLYLQYAETYERGGQRASQDTLAQMAARTGGMPSSWAETASQQTYNNFMGELANKVPELEQRAYGRYVDDIDMDRRDLEMLTALEQGDYAKYMDLVNKAERDRDFAYRAHRDQIGDAQWQQQFDYNANRDQIADQQFADKLAADLKKASMRGSSKKKDSTAAETADTDTMAQADIDLIMSQYPNGNIPDDLWASLAGMYGEGALTAAGFVKGGAQGKPKDGPKDTETSNMYDTVLGAISRMTINGETPETIKRMIRDLYKQGQISKSEMNGLLAEV